VHRAQLILQQAQLGGQRRRLGQLFADRLQGVAQPLGGDACGMRLRLIFPRMDACQRQGQRAHQVGE
jgi:hypothetical protein